MSIAERERLTSKILAKERLNAVTKVLDDVIEHIYCLPEKYRNSFESDAKYLGFKGGRGGGKSIAISGHFIEESYKKEFANCVFLFIREIAVSIEDSVYSLVVDLIRQANIEHDFKILARSITNKYTGVKFIFTGLRATGGKTAFSQINKVKGKHKIAKIFGEESQDLTEESLNTLFPTVNRSGTVKLVNEWRKQEDLFKAARFYFALNPNFDKDPIIAKLELLMGSRIEHINIFDIEAEFQDAQLLEEAENEKNEIYYDHVWLGAASYKIQGYPFAQLEEVRYSGKLEAYCCFIDPSFKGGDFTAITFIGLVKGELCAWGYCYKLAWNVCLDDMVKVIVKYNCKTTYYEDNSLGSVPQDLFAEQGINVIPHLTLGNKENRIYKVAGYVAHRCKLITNESNTQYVKNIKEYQEGVDHDDAPDSFASAMIKAGVITERMKF